MLTDNICVGERIFDGKTVRAMQKVSKENDKNMRKVFDWKFVISLNHAPYQNAIGN